MPKYNFKRIECKWQIFWEGKKFYRANNFDKRPKKYILIEFPYPSGDGLHVGHVRSYSALDALSRKKRMEGYNVLYPIGWDAFGLPTENYAIKKGIHPSVVTSKNIAIFKRQLKSLGLSFDWSREINTTDPKYYKWTQWIFLQFFKHGLAYRQEMPINWCPECKIGLANEEVIGGRCERCGAETEKRNIKQWLLKITKYADRLIDDLSKVDYQEKIKTQQINWIGRSCGAEVDFEITGSNKKISVFTTRIDTLFGATALVISPEHPLSEKLTTEENKKRVEKYISAAKKKSEQERTQTEKDKTGVFTGSYCVNPVNNEKIPIWIGDYVIAAYGGGAVMMVPAHDRRDYQFAKKFGLEAREVVSGGNIAKEAYVDYGILVNSGQFNGLKSEEAIKKITVWLKREKKGKQTVQYKLRDWIFSRQHYWGEPIPIIHCEKCGAVPVAEKDLPVKLPYVKKYKPTKTGESPLAAIEKWVNVRCPKCRGPAKRETDTMPNWAGSSWYYLAYIMNPQKYEWDKKKIKYWLPVDLYNGGMEHTTLHLLYSRFWHKFLYDIEMVPTAEPYYARRSHGMVLAQDGRKMSKSFGNVINPDDIVKNFGADALRMYEMFMGPFDQAISWSDQGVVGVYRFLNRIWKLQKKISAKGPLRHSDSEASVFTPGGKNNNENMEKCRECEVVLHKSIKKISEDLDNMKFNTAVSQLMILTGELEKESAIDVEIYKTLLKLLAPFAPHLSEELWSRFFVNKKSGVSHSQRESGQPPEGYKSVHLEAWPQYDMSKTQEEDFELVIQINGKVRATVLAPIGIAEEKAREIALSQERIKAHLGGKIPAKIIFIPNRLINIVLT